MTNRLPTLGGNSFNNPADHFAGAGNVIELGSGSKRGVDDYPLTLFAYYLSSGAMTTPPCANG